MKASLSTGGFRDFITLTAETTEECADLVRIGTSEFIEKDKVFFDFSYPIKTIVLKVWTSEQRMKTVDAETRQAIDQTP